MKYYLRAIFLVLIGINAKAQNYKLETQLLSGIYKVAENLNLDLKKEFEKFESYQIDQGVLQNNNFESYYEAFENIGQGKSSYSTQLSLPDSITFSIDFCEVYTSKANIENLKQVSESQAFKDSKLHQQIMAIDSLNSLACIIHKKREFVP
jgi:hypothetical protein